MSPRQGILGLFANLTLYLGISVYNLGTVAFGLWFRSAFDPPL